MEGNPHHLGHRRQVAAGGRVAICGAGYTENTNALHRRLVPGIISDLRLRLGPTQLLQQPGSCCNSQRVLFSTLPAKSGFARRGRPAAP